MITPVSPNPSPAVRSGYVSMSSRAWHEVSVLKFVNQYFILERPDLWRCLQRGRERTIEQLVVAFDHWLSDRIGRRSGPAPTGRPGQRSRLRLRADRTVASGVAGCADIRRRYRSDGARSGIIDYVSGLTDAQAVAYGARLSGASGLLWGSGL